MTPSIDIHSLFFHGQHIDQPKWFAGRKGDIEQALKSLCSPGSSILIYGERGVGKSSFLEMVKQIATGNMELLFKYGLHKIYTPNKFHFKVISVDCDADSTTTAKVLQRFLTSPEGLKKIVSIRQEQLEVTAKGKANIDLFQTLGLSASKETKVTSSNVNEESVFELFTNVVSYISKSVLTNGQGLLICIDEFDQVSDSARMASLIKNLSRNNVKFVISGIAESYQQLMAGHKSILRQLVYGRIEIRKMSFEDVSEIFKNVEHNTSKRILFEENFIREIFDKSGGYPYFVQLFGQLSLDNYLQTKGPAFPYVIHNLYLKKGLDKLRLFELELEKDYQSIIKDNPARELLLKYLARQIHKKIPDENILAYCHTNGVTQPEPRHLLANFLGQRDPHFLSREREGSEFVMWNDPLFKIYVNSREPDLIHLKNGEYSL